MGSGVRLLRLSQDCSDRVSEERDKTPRRVDKSTRRQGMHTACLASTLSILIDTRAVYRRSSPRHRQRLRASAESARLIDTFRSTNAR